MKEERFVLIMLGILGVLGFLILAPFLTYILFAIVLTVVLHPLYEKIKSYIKIPTLASLIVVLGVIAIIIIPSIYLVTILFTQGRNIISSLNVGNLEFTWLENALSNIGFHVNIDENFNFWIQNVLDAIKSYFLINAISFTGTVANFLTGIILVFFVMFYLLIDGKNIVKTIRDQFPLHEKYKNHLFQRVYSTMQGLFLGLFLSIIVQGLIAGIGFYIFGVPNAAFWGFVTAIVAIVPLIGTPVVYIPLAGFLILQGNLFGGVGLLVYGFILISNSDNVIRAHIAKIKSDIHPLSVILGAIGGVGFLGFSGILIGPLILELFSDVLHTYHIVNKKR